MSNNAKQKSGDSLVASVARQLREQIVTGRIKPGSKLPTQADLTTQYKVSRTVVREAIVALRADGLLEVCHGVGVFVLEPTVDHGGFKKIDRDRISSVIDMLELRAAVEIEAAALAAERRSLVQEHTLYGRFDELDRLDDLGKPTAAADAQLHLAIADASNNPRFTEFLQLIREGLIPRSAFVKSPSIALSKDYIRQIQAEHRLILEAISSRDSAGAKDAMRRHLKGSEDRYRKVLKTLRTR